MSPVTCRGCQNVLRDAEKLPQSQELLTNHKLQDFNDSHSIGCPSLFLSNGFKGHYVAIWPLGC